jgi:hypothetical protein
VASKLTSLYSTLIGNNYLLILKPLLQDIVQKNENLEVLLHLSVCSLQC